MANEDEEKTAFITEKGTYCYRMMPFKLKNAGVTYHKMMNRVFGDIIGKAMEVYIDDMIAKGKDHREHIANLEAIFERLRTHQMCLNPQKCTFGVQAGKFLGFMLTLTSADQSWK